MHEAHAVGGGLEAIPIHHFVAEARAERVGVGIVEQQPPRAREVGRDARLVAARDEVGRHGVGRRRVGAVERGPVGRGNGATGAREHGGEGVHHARIETGRASDAARGDASLLLRLEIHEARTQAAAEHIETDAVVLAAAVGERCEVAERKHRARERRHPDIRRLVGDERKPVGDVEDGTERAGVGVDVRDRGFRRIAIGAVTNGRIGVIAELVYGHAIGAVAKRRHQAITPEVALQDGETAVGVLPHAAVVGAGSIVGERECVGATTKIERRGEAAPIARAIGGRVALGEIVAHGDAVVGVARQGPERTADEREPGKLIGIRLRRSGRGDSDAVAAKPFALRLEGIGSRNARLAVFAKMDVTTPVSFDVELTGEGIGRAVEAECAVGLAAEGGVVADERARRERRALEVVGEVETEFARGLPVGGERVVVQALFAQRAGAAGVAALRVEGRIGHDERGGGASRRAVGPAHGGVVVGAGEVGADRVEDGAIVFDEGRTAILAAARAVARGDAQRGHGRSGRHGRGRDRDGAHAAGIAVVIPRKHLIDGRERLDDGPLIAAGLAHHLQGHRPRRARRD